LNYATIGYIDYYFSSLGDAPKEWITNDGLVHLKSLNKLEKLDLWGTRVTNSGLIHLSALPNLQKLVPTGTDITETGLELLKELPQLNSLDITCTFVEADYKEIRQIFPRVFVTGNPKQGAVRRRKPSP